MAAATWRTRATLIIALLVVLAGFQVLIMLLGLPGLDEENPWPAVLYLFSCAVDAVLALVLVVALARSLDGQGRPGQLAGVVATLETVKLVALGGALVVLLVLAWRASQRLDFFLLYLLAVVPLSAATLVMALTVRTFQLRRQAELVVRGH